MLKRYEQKVHIPTYIKDKTVAIDIFTYLHKSKGDKELIQKDLEQYLANAKHVIAVFDGSPSEERSASLLMNVSKRSEVTESIKAIKESLSDPQTSFSEKDKQYLNTQLAVLEKMAWQPSPEYMWEVCEYLKQHNAECIVLNKGEEADKYLPTISDIDIIISNDSDLLANGATNLIRTNGVYYNKKQILEGLQFTEEEWNIFIKLCRTMKSPNPEFIFTVMKLYAGDEEYIYERYEEHFKIHTDVLI